MTRKRTFSESWHRVAGLRLSLRPTIEVHKQIFRKEEWYVLADPFNNQFYRIRPEAYEFIRRLSPKQTVEQVWTDALKRFPETAPGQEEVVELVAQLFMNNLLYSDSPVGTDPLFTRYKKRKQRELQSTLQSIMFLRIPLFDPALFLARIRPLISALVSPAAGIVWLFAVIWAGKILIDNFGALSNQAQGFLTLNNLPLVYLALAILKSLHEMGHAMVCKRLGGEVHVMGVMFLIFIPLPYMDATASWSFRNRWHRMLVSASGIIVELFIAALATFLWANTGPEELLHRLAYNIIFIASVSTVLFNGNPLLRYDGYYILSDLLDIPNLHTRAIMQLRYVVERYLFGCTDLISASETITEAFWLVFFGIAAGLYRIVVFSGIIFYIANRFLLAGIILALVCIISWGIVPFFKFIHYLATSPKLFRNRVRAVFSSIAIFASIASALFIIPLPYGIKAPGILEGDPYARIVTRQSGYIVEAPAPSGKQVGPGDILVRLEDGELFFDMEKTRAQIQEITAVKTMSVKGKAGDLKTIEKRLEFLDAKLSSLLEKQDSLILRAPFTGIWVAPDIPTLIGAWVPRGTELGELVSLSRFRFTAVIPQKDAADLFALPVNTGEVRIHGQAEKEIPVKRFQIIPFEQNQLPSAALGWMGGGEVSTTMDDKTGRSTRTPFFQINARVDPPKDGRFFHGQSGRVRIDLPSRTLAERLYIWIKQIFQKRYKL